MKCTNCKLFGKCRKLRQEARNFIAWTPHNIIFHPLSEIIYLISPIFWPWRKKIQDFSNYLHDVSIPKHQENEGRG